MKKRNISDSIEQISLKLDELKNTDNLEILCKSQNDIQEEIKTTLVQLDELKIKLNKVNNDQINLDITDEQYKTLLNEIESMIIDSDTIEKQVDNYLLFKQKISLCKQYLEKKKLEIIEIK